MAATRARPALRRRTFQVPLYNLEVEQSWRVGRVTLRPPGWLETQVARHIERTPAKKRRELRAYYKSARDVASEARRWATAEVVARDIDEARDTVRGAIALLRLFQRGKTRVNVDKQTFGLPVDVFAILDRHMVLTRNRIATFGWQWHGVLASWKFTRGDIKRFREDGALAWLESALRTPPDARTDLQARAITALAFLNLATVLVVPPVRVAIQALSLEALLADRRRDQRRHRVAKRAAYLTCGSGLMGPDNPHGPERPACFYLEARSIAQVEVEEHRLSRLGLPVGCSWYADAWRLFQDRDDVMHEARTEFEKGAPVRYEGDLDSAILALAAWASRKGAEDLDDLDTEVEAFVRQGVMEGGLLRPAKRPS